MARVHFVFLQEEWKRDLPRVPVEDETVTFDIVDSHRSQDYRVSVVHWFDSYSATADDVFPEMEAWVSLYIPPEWPVVRDHPQYPGKTY